ncbi:major facilitator superfamily domain-containing protein [Aspergillus unguis]
MAGQSGSRRSSQDEITEPEAKAPWMVEYRSSKGFITWVVAIAVFTDVFIYGMIIPILPEVLKTRVSVPEDQLQQWTSNLLSAFGGALFIGSPICGYYADKNSSRQAPFMIGLIALAASTVMFWFARSTTELLVARIFQGLSCAVVWTVGLALVVDTMGQEQIGAAMGVVSMAMTVGTVIGPFIGGIVLSKAGYHAVFGTAIALIFVDIVLRLVMIERKNATRWIQTENEPVTEAGTPAETERLIDPASQNGSYETVGPELDPEQSNGNPTEASFHDRRRMPPMVRLLCSVTLLVVLQATLAQAMAWASFDSVLPLYVRSTFDMGPMEIGLCFVPLFLPSFLSTIIGHAVDRHGSRKIAFLGFILDVPVYLLLQLVKENTTKDLITLYALLFFAGLASAFKTVSLMVEVNHAVEEKEKECPGIFGEKGGTGQAYGLFNVAWSGGQVAGPLVAGWLVNWGGWGRMVSAFAVIGGVTALVLLGTAKEVRFITRR